MLSADFERLPCQTRRLRGFLVGSDGLPEVPVRGETGAIELTSSLIAVPIILLGIRLVFRFRLFL